MIAKLMSQFRIFNRRELSAGFDETAGELS
jgi:hypothetical protein